MFHTAATKTLVWRMEMYHVILKSYEGCEPGCSGRNCNKRYWRANIAQHLADWISENCQGSDYYMVSFDQRSIIGYKKIYERVRDYHDDNRDNWFWTTSVVKVEEKIFTTPEPIITFSLGNTLGYNLFGFASQEAEWRKRLAEQILAGQ